MLISIGPGKFATKAMSATKRIYFPTRLSPNPSIDHTGNTYHIQFQNQTYLLGEQAEQSDFDISKASLPHKLASYTAISQLQEFDHRIQLVLGCPLNIYKNKELRDNYKNYMLDERLIRLYVITSLIASTSKISSSCLNLLALFILSLPSSKTSVQPL